MSIIALDVVVDFGLPDTLSKENSIETALKECGIVTDDFQDKRLGADISGLTASYGKDIAAAC